MKVARNGCTIVYGPHVRDTVEMAAISGHENWPALRAIPKGMGMKNVDVDVTVFLVIF